MRYIKKHFKSISSILLVMLLIPLLASCQSVSGEPRADTNVPAAPESVPPASQNSTPPPAETPEPEPVPPVVNNSGLTPIEKMGVTGIAPAVDIPTYRLTITGLVEKPLSLTYQDLLAYPSMTEIVVVECPGFFRDIAEWTGVSLNTILAEAGITSSASQVALSAVDGYRQELSLKHVDEYGVFLAYKVNGQTLPPEHGFPLRVVDKGSLGAKWVKWLANIEVR